MDEAVVWERFVISAPDPAFDPALDGQWAQSAPAPAAAAAAQRQRQAGHGAAAGGGQAAAPIGGHMAAAAAQQDAAAEAAMLAEELAEDQVVAAAAAEGAASASADAPTAEGAGTAAAARGGPVGTACAGPLGPGAAAAAGAAAGQAGRGPVNSQLLKWGLSEDTARDALNPGGRLGAPRAARGRFAGAVLCPSMCRQGPTAQAGVGYYHCVHTQRCLVWLPAGGPFIFGRCLAMRPLYCWAAHHCAEQLLWYCSRMQSAHSGCFSIPVPPGYPVHGQTWPQALPTPSPLPPP